MATRKKNFIDNLPKINMQQAASYAGFSLDYNRPRTITNCPFCGGKKKFYIYLSSNGTELGAAHCMKCGEHLTPIAMFAYSLGLDYNNPDNLKESARQWYQLQRGDAPTLKTKKNIKTIPKTIKFEQIDVPQAPLEVRSSTYKELQNALFLQPNHKENLLQRGLSEKTISLFGYRSAPMSQESADAVVQTLLQKGCTLLGVPGFYTTKDEKWHMVSTGSGILLPQKNGLGQIQSFQIRRDTVDKGKRYISLSSRDYLNGAPASASCHFRRGNKEIDDVILTEGPLKADIISELTGYSVIAVAGVNSLSQLPKALMDLKAAGMRKITIAYDMDIRTNKEVQKAEKKLTRMLNLLQIPYSILSWDEDLKGLDDWAVKQPDLLKLNCEKAT